MNFIITQDKASKGERERKRQEELEQLQSFLSQLELECLNIRTELRAFEIRYLQYVGRFIAELDEIEASISELLYKLFPENRSYEKKAHDDRARAEQSSQEAHYASEQPKEKTKFQAPEDLRDLFRDVAKKVHPDFATNEDDCLRRSELMKQANRAYEEKDYDKLREILLDAELVQDTGDADKEKAEIERLDQKIARAKRRISQLESEIDQMVSSELYQMMERVIEAEAAGINLLERIAENLKSKIVDRKARLQELLQIYERKSVF